MRSDRALAGLLVIAGATHLFRPGFYDPIVPRYLPGAARAWTYGSGVVELAVAAALLVPGWGRRAALAAAVLFVLVFPANLQMAFDGGYPDASGVLGGPVVAWARLPLQLLLVWWAMTLARREPTT